MNISNIQHKNRSGSALIIVVVLIVMLSIVGFSFVMLSRIDAIGSESAAKGKDLDAASSYMIDRIAEIIAKDSYDPNSSGYGYDYPDNNNRWLASLEPYFDGGDPALADDHQYYYWRKISDVFGELANKGLDIANIRVQPEVGLSNPSGNRETIDEYQQIFIATENQDIDDDGYNDVFVGDLLQEVWDVNLDETISYNLGNTGQFADADGDGVADSKWFKVPNLRTAGGEYYYAAVRIIDNSGMININTTYSDDRINGYRSGYDYSFYGDSPLSINMEGLLNPSDDIDEFFNERAIDTFSGSVSEQRWNDYNESVVERLSNPDSQDDWRVFTLADELALRNRFCVNAGFNSRLEQTLLDTLNGQWGSTDRPFMGGDYGKLVEWCLAISGNEDISVDGEFVMPDRRHLFTTLSKTRELTPVQIKAADLAAGMEVLPGRRKAHTNTIAETASNEALTLEQIAGNIYYAIKDEDFTTKFGDYITSERLAWHFALNLIEYQSGAANPPLYKRVDNSTYFGFQGADALREDALIVSELGYFDNTASHKPAPANKYYILEIYNPDNSNKVINNLNDYKISVVQSDGTITSISLYADVFNSIETTILANSVILIASDKDNSFSIFGANAQYEYPALELRTDDHIFVHKLDWPVLDNADPVDMPVDRCEVTDMLDLTAVGERKSMQRMTEFGRATGLLVPNSWTDVPFVANLGGRPGAPFGIPGVVQINLEISDYEQLNIGEIYNAFAIGAYSDSDDVKNDMPFIYALEQSYVLKDTDTQKLWGRFDSTDDRTHGLFDYLTTFKAAWDGIDTDGNPATGDKPTIPLNERKASDYETVVHGRVNINTAPAKVLEQLPFMTEELAATVIARRDQTELRSIDDGEVIADYEPIPFPPFPLPPAGFRNIAEVLEATNNILNANYDENYDIQWFGKDGLGLNDYPDFAPDQITDDYRERDIIFQRISDNITVESDVFTAYILLREGAEGQQRRMIVIYDRSNVYEPGDMPRITVQKASQLGR